MSCRLLAFYNVPAFILPSRVPCNKPPPLMASLLIHSAFMPFCSPGRFQLATFSGSERWNTTRLLALIDEIYYCDNLLCFSYGNRLL